MIIRQSVRAFVSHAPVSHVTSDKSTGIVNALRSTACRPRIPCLGTGTGNPEADKLLSGYAETGFNPVDSLVRRSLYALKMRAKAPPSIRFKKMVTAGLIDSKGRLNRSPRPKMTLGDLMLKNQRASWRGT